MPLSATTMRSPGMRAMRSLARNELGKSWVTSPLALTPSQLKDNPLVITGKGGKTRLVPLLPEAKAAIEHYLSLLPFPVSPQQPLFRGAFGVVASAVVGAAHVPQMTKASWTAYIIAASGFGALVVVGLAWFLASHSNSKDLGRVRRQVRAIDVYAADLPHDVAVLLKAVVAPRVLTEHGADEPWSSPAWLSPDDVLCALGKPKREPRPKAAQGPAVAGPTP